MIKSALININGQTSIAEDAIKNIAYNNTFMPDITRVIFSLKTEEKVPVLDKAGRPIQEPVIDPNTKKQCCDRAGNPIFRNKTQLKKLDNPQLATVVYFDDGSKVTVQNSEHDKVNVKTVYLGKDGKILKDVSDKSKIAKEVLVADDCSKEAGLCYAIVRRLCGRPDPKTGDVSSAGLSKLLTNLVSDSYDQVLEISKNRVAKANAKAKAASEKKVKKAKPKHYTTNDVNQLIGKVLEGLVSKLELDPNAVKEVAEKVVKTKTATKKSARNPSKAKKA